MFAIHTRVRLWNELQLREFIHHFYESLRDLRMLCQDYHRHHRTNFALLDEVCREHVFPLKECSHRIFRLADAAAFGEDDRVGVGTVLDLSVGALFHAALEWKEQAHLLSNYRPRLEAMGVSSGGVARETRALERLVRSAAERLPYTVNTVSSLLESSQELVHRLLPEWRELRLVVLYVTAHERLLAEVYQPGGIETVLRCMFADGPAEGWFQAGRHLWALGHSDQALDAFERALTSGACGGAPMRRAEMKRICARMAEGEVWPMSEQLMMRARTLVKRLAGAG